MVRNLLTAFAFIAFTSTVCAAEPKPAYEMLPQDVQAIIWVPDAEKLATGWEETELAKLAEDPAIRGFWEDQRLQIEDKLTGAGWRLHIQPRDLEEIVQGQLALAWIEHRDDVRKPFALALIVDVVNNAAKTKTFLERLNEQLKERGAPIRRLDHNNVEIVQHTLPRKNGELLPQETFYAVANEQLLASDDLNTLKTLIDAATANAASDKMLNSDAVFQAARKELAVSTDAHAEYFVRPLGFARVLRAMGGKRASRKTDVLSVLQNQGFESIKAVCGELKLGQEKFDIVHRGYVLADSESKGAVAILDFPNQVSHKLPPWVSDRVSSMLAVCWNVEAFWKVEGLVDEMAGQEGVFREIIEGIKVDPTGPRIDIARDVMPLLTNEIYSITDAKMPIEVDSRRNLIALRVKKPEQMAKILRQAMATEPDAQEVSVAGQQIWQVAHEADDPTLQLDADFGDFGTKPANQPAAGNEPWLSNWAITVHGEYLMFASHVEMISEAIAQAKLGDRSPLEDKADYQQIVAALISQFGNQEECAWRINRSELAYRPQYELFRQGKLQESESMLATLLEHLLQNKSEIQQKKPAVNGSKLPPFEAISKYLHPSGVTVKKTDKGWAFGAILLSQTDRSQSQPTSDKSSSGNAGESNAATKPVQGAATKR